MDRYTSLPDETWLKLIADGKDWICDTCAFGSHCSAKSIWTKSEERIAMNLREAKREMGVQGVFVIRDHHKNGQFYALTTMGVLRSVLDQTKNTIDLLYHIRDINTEEKD